MKQINVKKSLCLAALLAASYSPVVVLADSKSASSHAPIGVMGDHLHKKGEFMFSYRYMNMDMQGNRIGTKRVSDRSVVGTMATPGQFMVVPQSMPMKMHMLGSMYGVSDKVTLMAMVNYIDNSMDHLVRNGKEFSTQASGFGDTKVSALIALNEQGRRKIHAGFGLSLPTGSTTERDDTPAMANAILPYPMQLGSGTYDLLPSITYLNGNHAYSWGAQLSAVIRTGENDEGYTLGDRIAATTWLAYDLSSHLSASVRLNYQDIGATDGNNPALNPMMVQTANTALHEGDRLDFGVGLNYAFTNGHRLAVEYSVPVSQDLVGPQLETDSVLTLGWQKAF